MVTVQDLKIDDVIMPPAREVRLWMRRALAERNLSERALYLTITAIDEAKPDKGGRWLLITTRQTAEWLGDSKPYPFKFKARPDSEWVKIA